MTYNTAKIHNITLILSVLEDWACVDVEALEMSSKVTMCGLVTGEAPVRRSRKYFGIFYDLEPQNVCQLLTFICDLNATA